jgi:hypothetical protein
MVQGIVRSTHNHYLSSRFFKRYLQIERERGLILDDEDPQTAQIGGHIFHSPTLKPACDTNLNGLRHEATRYALCCWSNIWKFHRYHR